MPLKPLIIGGLVGATAGLLAFLSGVSVDRVALPETGRRAPVTAASSDRDSRAAEPGPAAFGGLADPRGPAGEDTGTALADLRSIASPRARREAALTLVDALGGGRNAIARVADALPAADRANFVFDAIARHAIKDPADAFDQALELDGEPAQTEALTRIAKVLAEGDPRRALTSGVAVSDYALGSAYKAAVFREWASVDPGGFLAFLETAAPSDLLAVDDEALRIAARSDPGQLLASIDDVPPISRATAEQAALEALVTTDSSSAFAYVDSLPPGNARDQVLAATARSFATHDVDRALSWVNSRRPSEAVATTAVLRVLAEADPVRGVEVVIENLLGSDSIASGKDGEAVHIQSVLDEFSSAAPEDLAIVASRLSAHDNRDVRSAFEMLVFFWSRNDAAATHDWAAENSGRLTAGAVAQLAKNLGVQEPELAKQLTSRLPPHLQPLWVGGVGEALAREDLDDALRWISTYQGPGFEVALGKTLGAGVRGSVDPATGARFLERQSPALRAAHLPAVASLWAREEPAAAARWVESIVLDAADEHRRTPALANVASLWARKDPAGARDWALQSARGVGRDQVLGSLLRVTAETGLVDSSVVDGLSSADTQQRTLISLMRVLGRSAPDVGRALIGQHIEDPALRAQAEEQLALGATSNQPEGITPGTSLFN